MNDFPARAKAESAAPGPQPSPDMRSSEIPGHDREVAEGWRPALAALALALAGLFVAFWGTVSQMVETWYVSATFNHGFMIVPIVGWLVWERREALEKYAPRPSFVGLVPLFVCVGAWTVANAAAINSGKEFALVGMIQSIVLTVLGWRLVRAMLFPLAFLFFAVPFGDFLVPMLQDVTAVMVVEGLRAIDIPVFLDGVFLTIPSGKFEVAEACSGVRFLIATVALGCLFANMSFRSPLRRAIILVLAVIVPIVANGMRAFGIVYIAYITDHKVAVGVDHLIYGWIFFAIVTVLLLGIGMTFRETDGDNEIYMPRPSDRAPGRHATGRGFGVAVAGCVALAAAGPAYADIMLRRGVAEVGTALTAPPAVGDWSMAGKVSTDWRPRFVGADAELMRTYRKGEDEVHLYVAYYTHQRQHAELINSLNTFVEENRWVRASSGAATADIAGRPLAVKTTRLIGADRGRVVWEWYWIGGRYTSNRLVAKGYEAAAKLFGTNQAAAAVVVTADFADSPADAARTLQDFVGNLNDLSDLIGRVSRN